MTEAEGFLPDVSSAPGEDAREKLDTAQMIELVSFPHLARSCHPTLREAFHTAVAQRQVLWSVSVPLEIGIKGSFHGYRGEELLDLTIGERSATIPRGTSDRPGISVSTDYVNWFDLVLPVFEWDDEVFDRGLFWMAINNSEQARMKFSLLRNHPADVEELMRRAREGEKRAIQMVNNFVDGLYSPPELL